MNRIDSTMARQIALAVSEFQQTCTGFAPNSVAVVFSEDTLVVTLHGALPPAEKALARQSPAGAAQMQQYHRQLFADACEPLQEEIRRIAGVEVREATAELETTTGTLVQGFLLAQGVSDVIWSGQLANTEQADTEISD
jgi:uncharacterized protein YbcI